MRKTERKIKSDRQRHKEKKKNKNKRTNGEKRKKKSTKDASVIYDKKVREDERREQECIFVTKGLPQQCFHARGRNNFSLFPAP